MIYSTRCCKHYNIVETVIYIMSCKRAYSPIFTCYSCVKKYGGPVQNKAAEIIRLHLSDRNLITCKKTMVEKGKFLVVVAVLEGRRFPRRPHHQIIVEAKFDGELLSTDPIEHIENPEFTQELAWELDKKGLQQHRLQRASIKIICYALDMTTSVKEQVGYVVLDLRSAHNKQTTKWYPLLLGKYQKNKPEIRLGLYLDEDKSLGNTSFKDKEAPAHIIEEIPVGSQDVNLLKPILNEDEGYYQLGPPKQCTEQFVLSVTIVTAANLTQVHLCCGEQSLGKAEIPLNTLLKKGSKEIYMKPVSVEGCFELVPPSHTKQQISAVPSGLTPVVGLSVVLMREDMAMRTPVKDGHPSSIRTPTSNSPTPKKQQHLNQRPSVRDHEEEESRSLERRTSSPEHTKQQKSKETDYDEDFKQETHENVSSLDKELHRDAKNQKGTDEEQTQYKSSGPSTSPKRLVQQNVPSESDTSTTQHHVAIPPQSHHFLFSIDLRSVKCLDNNNTQNVFLRYTYPFFGSAAPILTHPPVEIRKGMEVLLPQSFCAFDFACNIQQLQETFLTVPLIIEVWSRDKQLSKDVLLGVAKLPLSDIIATVKTKILNNTGNIGWKQLYSNKIPVIATDLQSKPIGEISFVLSLEDWGPLNTQQIVMIQPNSVGIHSVMDSYHNEAPNVEPRETNEYKAAMELEVWKEQQEHAFENQLKQKETMHMKAFAEEWKRRDREREILMKKKLTEYAQLEDRLKKTLVDLEKREKQLAANEQEVMRLKNDLLREHSRKLQEMKEASKRMQDDYDHKVELEKVKSTELQQFMQRYKDELNDAEKRRAKIEKDFTVFKEELNTKPEVRLQSEINLLTLEKVELERKLDAITKSKIHYKQQCCKALKELARLQQKEQAQAKANLMKQQQELEHMRLRYLAAEEKEVVNSEKKELEDVKNELNKLKQMEQERIKSADHSTHSILGSGKGDQEMDIEERITRLIEERDTLLRTGVYMRQDRIIAELDRQIREAMGNRKLSNV